MRFASHCLPGDQVESWIRSLRAAEFMGFGELRLELFENFGADLKTASLDPWADRGPQIRRLGMEGPPHLAHRLFDDALRSAAPAGMNRGGRVQPGINHQHRKAISSLDAHHHPRPAQEQSVARPA